MIDAEMRERRRGWVGASDLAPILDLSDFQNAADVYAEKVFGVDEDQTLAAMMGTEAEYLAMNWAERLIGDKLDSRGTFLHECETGIEHFAVNLDGLLVRDGIGISVEGKTAGITGPTWGEWGPDWTDQVPIGVTIQGHAQMLALDGPNGKPTPMTYVAALIGGRGPAIYEIPRNDEMIEMIREAIPKFWQRVIDKNPPDACYLDIDTARHLRRPAGKTIPLVLPEHFVGSDPIEAMAGMLRTLSNTTDMLDAYKLLGDLSSKADKLRKNECRKPGEPESPYEIITTLMRDAEIGELPDGRSVSYKASTSTRVDRDVLRMRYKDAWKDGDCVGETVSRRLLAHKAKGGG